MALCNNLLWLLHGQWVGLGVGMGVGLGVGVGTFVATGTSVVRTVGFISSVVAGLLIVSSKHPVKLINIEITISAASILSFKILV